MSMRHQNLIAYALLILAAGAAYLSAFSNSFVLDDYPLILQNTYLRGWGHFGEIFSSSLMRGANIACSFYRPLQTLLYLFIYHVSGTSPVGYHFVNIALHCANACLLYTLGRKLSFNPVATFVGALIWALHPIHVEAVAYMSATADVLYSFFCLCGILALLPDFTPRKVFLAALLFILALLSKETAIVFPLLVMSCLFLLRADRLNIKIYLCTLPLWVVAAVYVFIHMSVPAFAGFDLYRQTDPVYAQHILCRVFTFLATLPAYLGLLLWPVLLHPLRNFPIYETPWHFSVLIGFVLLIAVTAYIIKTRKQDRPVLSWGLLWFFSANLLQNGIILPINGIFMEHWMYLPTAGLFLALTETVAQTIHSRKVQWEMIAVTAAIILAYGIKTEIQTMTWRNPETYYANIFRSDDYLPQAHNGLGTFYLHKGNYAKAADQFERAIQQSNDTLAESQYDLGIVLLKSAATGDDKCAAIPHLTRALELNPDLFQATYALAMTYEAVGDNEKADFYRNQTNVISQRVMTMFGAPK